MSLTLRSTTAGALLILAAAAHSLRSQGTAIVPAQDPAYLLLDRLVAARAMDSVILGQRQLSRVEILRALSSADPDRLAEAGLSSQTAAMQARFRNDSTATWRLMAAGETMAARSPSRGIAPDANGAIDVAVNPLLGNQSGRRYADGTTYAASVGAELTVTDWLSARASGRAAWFEPRAPGAASDGAITGLSARALWRNVGVEVGRIPVFLGQGVEAGLTNSLNARAVDMVRVGSERPFALPWIFSLLGPARATAYLGDLGSAQGFPHTRIAGYKLSARPHQRFELGVTVAEQVGGSGAPGGTLAQKLTDAFPLIDAIFLHRNFLFSNKFVGMDARLTVPGLRGTQLYMEGVFDDFDARRLRSVFTEDAGYVWGLSQSCFRSCAGPRLSAEYHVTGLRYYTHGIFTSGFTVDRQIIGDQLGPRGRSGQLFVDGFTSRGQWRLALAHDIRSGDKYGSVSTTTDDSDFHFVKLEQNPAERRWRAMGSWENGIGPRLDLTTRAGVERVENFAHTRGWRTNWMLQLGLEYTVSDRR